jgi:predicted DNA-binding ribbon-helix-helix protein
MKTKQEMISRSIYMPVLYWKSIDTVAENEDLSANQVIRRLVSNLMNSKTARPALKDRCAKINSEIKIARARLR